MLMTSGYPGRPHIHHLPHLDLAERHRLHGWGRVEPRTPVTVGALATVVLDFELGETPVPAGGHLRVAWLWPYDWAPLQTDDSDAVDHARVTCSRHDVELRLTYAFRGDLIPWNHHLDVEVVGGALRPGDRVHIVCTDWRAPTFIAPQAEFLLLLNPEGGERWLQVPAVDGFPLVAGPAARLVALAPTDVVVGEELELTLRVEDEWGNPRLVGSSPHLEPFPGGTASPSEPATPMPAYLCRARFTETGTHRLRAHLPDTNLQATVNPIRVTSEPPVLRVFWGDLHAGQGSIGCGTGSVTHHFDYARQVAGLHFATHQANDHHVSLDLWEETRRETQTAHEEGAFVTLLGCEWSASTPYGGDRNVIYRRDEPRLRRSGRFFTEDVPDPEPDLTTAAEFLAAMREEPVFINLHAGGRPTNFDFHEPRIESLVEIHSTHGTSDWFVEDALRRGYRVGITAGTDGVTGRPGADHPGSRLIRNLRHGVTGFYLPELTREALWQAIAARRCYATTGERILLHVEVDEHLMGSEFETRGEPLITISIEGTAAVEEVEILCVDEVLWSWRPEPAAIDGDLRVLWSGTEQRGTASDQRAVWDGRLEVRRGSVRACRAVGFVSPEDRFTLADAHNLSWTSVTAGNRMGLILQLDGSDALCRFESGPASFEFTPDLVRQTPLVVDAGGVNRRVMVGPAPDEDAPRHLDLSWRDTRPVDGVCPYWVRVTQVDQQRAWSSPVYVTRRSPEQ